MPPGMPYNIPTIGGVPTQGTDYSGPQQPAGGAPNVGTTQNALGQLIQLISQQRQAALPKPLPPNRVQAGDLSRNYAPFSPGSNKYNAKVTVAQSVGNLIANVENREEEKKARDIAYDVSRLEEIMRNPTPENRDLANQIMLKDPNNPQAGLSKRGKEIQKALDIDFGSMLGGAGKTDTVDGYIKKARQQIAGIFHRQTPTPQQQQQPQPVPQQGMGGAGPMGGAPPMPMGGAAPAGATAQPQPQAQGQPAPMQQQGARPNTIQPMDAFSALQRQMPQVMGFTPEAQLQAQAIQAGLLPTADKVSEQQWHNFETTAKLAIAQGVIDEKDLERLSKDARSDNVSRRMLAIAEMNNITKLQQTQMTAGATNTRTRMLGQIADSRNITQGLIQSSKQLMDSTINDAKTQKDIINSKNSTSAQKKAAQAQLDHDNLIQEGLRTNITDLQRQWNSMGTMLDSPTATSSESAGQSDKSDDGALNQLLQSILQD